MAGKRPPLTEMRERFAVAYLRLLDATKAAIEAGYSEKTAAQQGYKLLRVPEIKAVIDAGRADYKKTLNLDAYYVMAGFKRNADKDDGAVSNQALTQIGKHLGLFVERHEFSGPNGGAIEVNDARARLAERLAKRAEGSNPGSPGGPQ